MEFGFALEKLPSITMTEMKGFLKPNKIEVKPYSVKKSCDLDIIEIGEITEHCLFLDTGGEKKFVACFLNILESD